VPEGLRPHQRPARRHLLSVVTLDQEEIGAKTNETRHFRPFLAPLDLVGTVVTFDALHAVRDNGTWLVEAKQAFYIAVIKANQKNVHRQSVQRRWPTSQHGQTSRAGCTPSWTRRGSAHTTLTPTIGC
jgi:hypothetical protein